jgi:transposase
MAARTESHLQIPSRADLLTAMQAQIAAFEAEVAALQSSLRDSQDSLKLVTCERDLYHERWKAALGKLFAARSEARTTHQQDLLFNEAEALAPVSAAPPPKIEVPAHTRVKRGRKPLDAALPREVVRHELPAGERVCPHDGTALEEIGVEASEQLDIIPAQIKVIRHERVKYACPCCRQGVKTAPAPKKLLPKGLLTENALAWVITAKYQDALPLYRQANLLNRFGGDLARHTLAHNVMRVGRAVQPIVNLLADTLQDAELILGDETELKVLNEAGRPAQAKSYLWVRMSGTGPPVRLFSYAPSRSAKTALTLYEGVHGALLTDGYEAYAQVAAAHGLAHLGCWAHARRKFVEAEAVLPKFARHALPTQFIAAIGELYAVEQDARELDAPHRLALRQARSVAVLARIEALLLTHLHSVLPQSLLGRALHYLQGQWPKLTRFVQDGRYPIDNNACENALRPFVIGRKNWLFADSVAGATASANLYSLIETAKANGIEPYRYLAALFKALPHANMLGDYEALLPWRIQLPSQ